LLVSVHAYAETMYVSDIVKITLRTGPGTDHRVIAMLQSGQSVEALNAGEEWTQVRLPNGKEGWVLNRLLTEEKPKVLLLEQMREKNNTLSTRLSELLNENKSLIETNERLETELGQQQTNLKELSQSYETLKKESSEFLTIQKEYKKSAADLAKQIKKATEMEAELRKLRLNHNIKWFLIGAGVLLFGFLIGFSAKRQRRRYMV